MSERTASVLDAETAEGLSSGRALVYVVGALFWGYLLVRWLYDWGLANLLGMSKGAPFLPVDALEAIGSQYAGTLVGGFFSFLAVSASSLPSVANGAWLSIVLTVVSILLGLVIAVPLSVARVYGGRVLTGLALGYTELIRGTPLLAQLFVLYFGLSLSATIRAIGCNKSVQRRQRAFDGPALRGRLRSHPWQSRVTDSRGIA